MSHADTQLKEQKDHGTSLFPCALYEVCEEKNWSGVPHHWHDEMEILYFSKGSYTLFVNMEQFQIEEKCFYFIYPGELPCHCSPFGQYGVCPCVSSKPFGL